MTVHIPIPKHYSDVQGMTFKPGAWPSKLIWFARQHVCLSAPKGIKTRGMIWCDIHRV